MFSCEVVQKGWEHCLLKTIETLFESPRSQLGVLKFKVPFLEQRSRRKWFDIHIFYSSDPCYNVFCTKGRMCVVNTDRSTTCVCPEVCPDDYKPVCSVYLREFNNTCKLHKFACRIGIMMGIEKTGKCDLKGVYLANKIRMSRKVVGKSASDNPER